MEKSSRKNARPAGQGRQSSPVPPLFSRLSRRLATGAGAVVMAVGIFIDGALEHFPALNEHAGRLFALTLLALFLVIGGGLLTSLLEGTMRERHFRDPIDSFGIGTWVAGTCVCATVILHRMPQWRPVILGMIALGVALWVIYLHHLAKIACHLVDRGVRSRVHGVVLLSTVSTQSIVIVLTTAFGRDPVLAAIVRVLFYLGVGYYLIGFLLIAARYLRSLPSLDLDRDWANSNCIIHGAMSITGLAACVSGVLPPDLLLGVWLWVLAAFILVEAVEVLRAGVRIRRHGIVRAVGEYSVTQWARNFTFGMLYAFSLKLSLGGTGASSALLQSVRSIIVNDGAWVVLLLLVYEVLLGLGSTVRSSPPNSMQQEP